MKISDITQDLRNTLSQGSHIYPVNLSENLQDAMAEDHRARARDQSVDTQIKLDNHWKSRLYLRCEWFLIGLVTGILLGFFSTFFSKK